MSAEVLDISDCERLPFDQAFRSEARACRTVLATGGEPVQPLPMLWPCPSELQIAAHHDARPAAPDVDVYVLRHARLTGPGAQPRLDQAHLRARAALPLYVPHFIATGEQAALWAETPGTRPKRVEQAFSVIHYNQPFGHWLTEMFPKLFLIRRLAERGITAPIALPTTAPTYMADILAEVLPGQSIVRFDPTREHIVADRLILPGMMQVDYAFHPWFADEIVRHIADCRRPSTPRSLGQAIRRRLHPAMESPRLFVSRRNVGSGFRTLENADELEGIARELGFTVIEPQRMSWRDQVASFAAARTIVGEYGSGMHNSLFAGPGATVVCLNWVVEVQSRLCHFRRQRVGYLLADDGAVKLYRLEGGRHSYAVDPRAFRERVLYALSQTEPQDS